MINRLTESSVLVVEDEEYLRNTLKWALSQEFAVVTAEGGDQAVGILGGRAFAAILLDICMPKGDGFSVISHLMARGDGTPVIVLSAIDDPKRVAKIMGLGIANYLVKPCSGEDILCAMREASEARSNSLQALQTTFSQRPSEP